MDAKDAPLKTTWQEEKTHSTSQEIQKGTIKNQKNIVVENAVNRQEKEKDVFVNYLKIEEKKCYHQEDVKTVGVMAAMIMMNQIPHPQALQEVDQEKVQA